MRNRINKQLPIVYNFIEHEHADELRQISEILDSFGTELVDLIHARRREPGQGTRGHERRSSIASATAKADERLQLRTARVSHYGLKDLSSVLSIWRGRQVAKYIGAEA